MGYGVPKNRRIMVMIAMALIFAAFLHYSIHIGLGYRANSSFDNSSINLTIMRGLFLIPFTPVNEVAFAGNTSAYVFAGSIVFIGNANPLYPANCAIHVPRGYYVHRIQVHNNLVVISIVSMSRRISYVIGIDSRECKVRFALKSIQVVKNSSGKDILLFDKNSIYIYSNKRLIPIVRLSGIRDAAMPWPGCYIAKTSKAVYAIGCCNIAKPTKVLKFTYNSVLLDKPLRLCTPSKVINLNSHEKPIDISTSGRISCILYRDRIDVIDIKKGNIHRYNVKGYERVIMTPLGCIAEKDQYFRVIYPLGSTISDIKSIRIYDKNNRIVYIRLGNGTRLLIIGDRIYRIPISPTATIYSPKYTILDFFSPLLITKLGMAANDTLIIITGGGVSYKTIWLYTGIICRDSMCSTGIIVSSRNKYTYLWNLTDPFIVFDKDRLDILGRNKVAVINGYGNTKVFNHHIKNPITVIPLNDYNILVPGIYEYAIINIPRGAVMVYRGDPIGLIDKGLVETYLDKNTALVSTISANLVSKQYIYNVTIVEESQVIDKIVLASPTSNALPQLAWCSNGTRILWVPESNIVYSIMSSRSTNTITIIEKHFGKPIYYIYPGNCTIIYHPLKNLTNPFIVLPDGKLIHVINNLGIFQVKDGKILHTRIVVKSGLYGPPSSSTSIIYFENGTWKGIGAALETRRIGVEDRIGLFFAAGTGYNVSYYRVVSNGRVVDLRLTGSIYPLFFTPKGAVIVSGFGGLAVFVRYNSIAKGSPILIKKIYIGNVSSPNKHIIESYITKKKGINKERTKLSHSNLLFIALALAVLLTIVYVYSARKAVH